MSTSNVNGLFMRTDVKVVIGGIHRERENRKKARPANTYNTRFIDYYKLYNGLQIIIKTLLKIPE